MSNARMSDRKNVISCLEQCLDDSIAAVVPADTVRDAIALLKAQGPRVMALEEALGDDEVWFEFRPSNVGRYADCYMNDGGDRTCVYFTGKSHMSLFENAEYGKYWRCWTSRPTDAHREATPWES